MRLSGEFQTFLDLKERGNLRNISGRHKFHFIWKVCTLLCLFYVYLQPKGVRRNSYARENFMFCHRWIDSHQASTFCLELVKVVCLSTMSHINALMIKAHQAFKTILKSKSYLETMQQSAFRPGFLPCMLMQVKKWLWRKEAISRQWNHKFLGRSQSR